VSHLTALLVDVRRRAPREPQPFDSLTKAELWDRLKAAEKAMATAAASAQTAATLAHNYAQGASGMDRRAFFAIRDAAYKARDAVQLTDRTP